MVLPQDEYMASKLWMSTLAMSADDEYARHRERLRVSYISLRKTAAVLMAEAPRDNLPFTVHDITHVDALWETADLVCGDETVLTPAEGYVLGCAFVVHDAAMSGAAYKDGLPAAVGVQKWRDLLAHAYFARNDYWPDESELDSPSPDVFKDCQARAIRQIYADYAKRLVDESWQSDARNPQYLIEDVGLRESYGPMIGDLAASHWWDVQRLAAKFRHPMTSHPLQPLGWTVDRLKLACILRLADAAHIDSRRAPTFLFSLRRPKGESLDHWRFQEHTGRPQPDGDYIKFTSLRPFPSEKASAWWLALDYLRDVDRELKKVDALLHDLGRPGLAVRAVEGVDSEARFAERFEVENWRPVDATVQISDVSRLVNTLGGAQLYGRTPEVAVRELIQNAQDAVLARQRLEPEFTDGRVDVTLTERQGTWTLEVRDNGIGMDEDLLVHGLLDFGRSGWSTEQAQQKFPGLAGSSFRPRGRFGIGFFSVFMLGDEVEIVTRRIDGASADARRLRFTGLHSRPILAAVGSAERPPYGTSVQVTLAEDPYSASGIFAHISDQSTMGLVRMLVLENSVPIHTCQSEQDAPTQREVITPFSLASGSPEDVFDRLHPPGRMPWQTRAEKERLTIREEFVHQATEMLNAKGRRVGLAALNYNQNMRWSFEYAGAVPIDGFLGDEFGSFLGYLEGRPSRASRDQPELVADADAVRAWHMSQLARLKERGLFGPSAQLVTNAFSYYSSGNLENGHYVGMTASGLIRYGDIEQWASQRDEVFVTYGGPLRWSFYSPDAPLLYNSDTGREQILPANWLTPCPDYIERPFSTLFPGIERRDANYEFARAHREPTWQKTWWSLSGDILGGIIHRICKAWSCEIGDVLAPIAARHWDDFGDFEDPSMRPADGYLLRRPGRTVGSGISVI